MFHTHTPLWLRVSSFFTLIAFVSYISTFTIQSTFASSIVYYIDATNGSDLADGLTPATAWQTLTKANSAPLLSGDTLSFLCWESYSGSLSLLQSGIVWEPITINSYGSCDGTNKPTLEGVTINNVSYITLDGLSVYASGSSAISVIGISPLQNIRVLNTNLSAPNSQCILAENIDTIDIQNNLFTNCQNGFSGSSIWGSLFQNTFSWITLNAVTLLGDSPVNILQNTLHHIGASGIIFAKWTSIVQNNLTNICTLWNSDCAAITNEKTNPISTNFLSNIHENIIKNVGSGISGNNYGVDIRGIAWVDIVDNTIQNAEKAIYIEDSQNLNIYENINLLSRATSLQTVQKTNDLV